MANYEEYSQYRNETLSATEEAKLNAVMNSTPDPSIPRPAPKVAAHIALAVDRAKEQLKDYPFPEGAHDLDGFENMDPHGKHSRAELDFQRRIDRLNYSTPHTFYMAANVQRDVMEKMGSTANRAGRIYDEMRKSSQKQAHLSRASKLCLDPEGSRLLEEQAKKMETEDEAFRKMDGMLNLLEYAANLVPELNANADFVLQGGNVLPISRSTLPDVHRLSATNQAPSMDESFSIDFQNMDNHVSYQYLSNPENWGKSMKDAPQDFTSEMQADETISRYAAASVSTAMDSLFDPVERKYPQHTMNNINRGNLIIIDGKTAREHIEEKMMKENPNATPKDFHARLKAETAQLVSAAMMAGKRVEVFVPDKDGKIPAQPTQLTKTGYEPSPLKKVTLNRWERHFAKHGFYKEKANKAAEYQRTMAARERVAEINKFALADKEDPALGTYNNSYFGENHAPLPREGAFRVPATVCIAALVGQGKLTLEEALDPTSNTRVKQAMGQEFLRRAEANDTKWLADVYMDAADKIGEQTQKLYMGLNKNDTMNDPKFATFCGAGAVFASLRDNFATVESHMHDRLSVGLDESQFTNAYQRTKHLQNIVSEPYNKYSALSEVSGALRSVMNSRIALNNPAELHCDDNRISKHLTGIIAYDHMQKDLATNPDPEAFQYYGFGSLQTMMNRLGKFEDINALSDKAAQSVDLRHKLVELSHAGTLASSLGATADKDLNYSVDRKTCEKSVDSMEKSIQKANKIATATKPKENKAPERTR